MNANPVLVGQHAAGPAASHSFDVGDADFAAAVVERSHQVPVLLDIWAPWCGPCRALGPVLEKLAVAYEGRFKLAKLNSDENPGVATALQVRSIPQVVLFKGGRPVDQFMGALPESQVRAFLDRHVAKASEGERLRQAAAATARADEAEQLLQQALELEPTLTEATLDLAARRLDAGDPARAIALLDGVPPSQRGERHAALLARARLSGQPGAADTAALARRLDADPRDFEAAFELAAAHARQGDFGAAFDRLLDVVQRDKGESRERARAQLVEWFGLCENRALVGRARRLLGMYLH